MGDLTTAFRKNLPKSEFAIPEKAPGSGSYPIPDIAHARDALARSSGKSVEDRVKAAVHKKFPILAKGSGSGHDPVIDKVAQKKQELADAKAKMHKKYPHLDPSNPGSSTWS